MDFLYRALHANAHSGRCRAVVLVTEVCGIHLCGEVRDRRAAAVVAVSRRPSIPIDVVVYAKHIAIPAVVRNVCARGRTHTGAKLHSAGQSP